VRVLLADVEVPRHQQDPRLGAYVAQLLGDLEPGHPRHVVVEHDQVVVVLRGAGERVGSVAGDGDVVPGALEHEGDEVADVLVVVGDEEAGGHGSIVVHRSTG
jgi:hypothetical protein